MTPNIKIIISDDHPVSLHGLLRILEAAPEVAIIGEARDGAEAWQLLQTKQPDVALLDMRLPILDGLELARRIQRLEKPMPFIFLTMWKEEAIFNEAISLGCSGYLLKESAAEEMVIVSVETGGAVSLNRVFGPIVTNGDFLVRFAGLPGNTYTIEYTDSVAPVNWQKTTNLTAPTTAGSYGRGVFQFSQSAAGVGFRFYRTVYPAY